MPSCAGCGQELEGRQKRWCADKQCRREAARASRLRTVFDISPEEWQLIWEEQGMVCAICQRKPRPGESFHLDHAHEDGQAGTIRGIVCGYDNTRIIGRLKSPERAQALADYLRDPPAVRALNGPRRAPGRPKRKRQPRKRPRG